MNNCELANSVKLSLEQYFKDLDGQPPHAVYDMVLSCIEKPLLEHIMQHASGNQSKAAEILGLNRNTLRKKLQQYNIE
ncbi:MAG TPA: DNA-binding transcriptional regulator Fis [Methylotenera sp.]|jgi:Fis family transcriptional regulator|nr:DNA-binding transcriptional regulator Fis [Methylotenera sp.]